ncbi:hypothetical protein M5E87_07110 [Flavonifractor plautii]|nr:hypothetical protein M5E87_07110 [Flavonifractor plautii]
MFQNDYRREMDGLRPSPAAVERLNRMLEEGAPGGPGGWAAGRPRPWPCAPPCASPPWRRAPCGTRWRPGWGPTPLCRRGGGKRPARASGWSW